MTEARAARVIHDAGQIASAVTRLGNELSEAYPDGVLLVAVLKGSIFFLADLARRHVGPL